jgi:hypothetical protein
MKTASALSSATLHHTALLISFFLAVASASANDSEAYLVGGAIVLKKSTSISMESEVLTISPRLVRVEYRFHNRSASPVETRVAFPIRAFVDPEEVPDLDDFVASVKFSVKVEGKPVAVESTVQQRSDSIEVMYHWPMTFPANATISVTHEYTPRGGYIMPAPKDYPPFWTQFARDYCIDRALLEKMRRRPGSAQPVHYILRTATNWIGPIGRFRLVVELDEASQLVSMCPTGLKKSGKKRYVLERKNFTPTTDLNIVFVRLADR